MFTQEVNRKTKQTFVAGIALLGTVGIMGYFGFDNAVTDVGYRPEQPIPFSHKLHAGELNISCMYCHNTVEKSGHSAVPSTSTCMNCHIAVKAESPKIAKIKDSWENNKPIEWRRVHKLPDYVRFNHARHIRAQIDCASCHGEVEKMGVVTQMKSLSMGWCLDCHRNPQQYVVPAREISGIFTGTQTNEEVAKLIKNEQPSWGEGKWKPVRDGKIEAIGTSEHDLKSSGVPGLAMPKKLALGPENCSSCHY
jgi:hypothetical protein